MTQKRSRLDQLLFARGLSPTVERAQALILAGRVRVQGEVVRQAGSAVAADLPITIEEADDFVSRGGLKLAHGIDTWKVPVAGKLGADIGAATGGFTDALLQRGARHVYAVDVGYGDLAWKLRTDARVTLIERTNARNLESLPERVDIVAIDVSFISLSLLFPRCPGWLNVGGEVIALIKPQFEARRTEVPPGGVVTSLATHRQILQEVVVKARAAGFAMRGLIPSPIQGGEGNIEYLVRCPLAAGAFSADAPIVPEPPTDQSLIDEALASAQRLFSTLT